MSVHWLTAGVAEQKYIAQSLRAGRKAAGCARENIAVLHTGSDERRTVCGFATGDYQYVGSIQSLQLIQHFQVLLYKRRRWFWGMVMITLPSFQEKTPTQRDLVLYPRRPLGLKCRNQCRNQLLSFSRHKRHQRASKSEIAIDLEIIDQKHTKLSTVRRVVRESMPSKISSNSTAPDQI